ncbi:transcriptional regulator GcvA [Paraburkholderia xenovorans]|nr:transcriptional regulator GcvA [Paraburkholderia xenovorans]
MRVGNDSAREPEVPQSICCASIHESKLWKARFMSQLPPLAALKAFESAARHRSFTKAAQELFVTQSAISRHVRHLEQLFGIPLFYRDHRAVTLTPEGEAYMYEVVEAFSRIDLATRRLKVSGRQNILNLQAYSTFAMYWLIPRLGKFQQINPEIDVRLTASTAPLDFDHTDIHASIRTVNGPLEDDLRGDKLFDYRLIAVGAPAALSSQPPLREPGDLKSAMLLHSMARPEDWGVWLNAVGANDVPLERGLRFESSAMVYLAAQQGLGIAIAQSFLIQEELQKGFLTKVFPYEVPSERTYYLLSSPRHVGDVALELFRKWLLDELASDPLTARTNHIEA